MTPATLVSLIDLTSLNDADTPAHIEQLCQQAQTRLGPVAAVCIYPQFVAQAKSQLADCSIQIATVANFPAGNAPLSTALSTIDIALEHGATEIDVVMPYHLLHQNEVGQIKDFLTACRAAITSAILKVIIESSALSATHVEIATKLVADSGADFVKTSTGKSYGGATRQAVTLICETLKAMGAPTGIKVSGGLRTTDDANQLLDVIANYYGETWIVPQHVRIGASRLLKQLTDPTQPESDDQHTY